MDSSMQPEQSFASNSFSFVSGFDQQMDALFGGKQSELGVKVFLEFGQVFLSSVDSRIEKLEQALKDQDLKQLQHMAHQMRGSFRTLGATLLADNCQKIEDHIKKESSPQADFAAPLVKTISESIPKLKADLQEYLNTLPRAS